MNLGRLESCGEPLTLELGLHQSHSGHGEADRGRWVVWHWTKYSIAVILLYIPSYPLHFINGTEAKRD